MKHKGKIIKRCAAFTLIELVVVIGVMALLAGLVVPSVQSMMAAQKKDQCKEQLERIAQAIVKRAEVLSQNLEFNLALWENWPTVEDSGSQDIYTQTSASYWPALSPEDTYLTTWDLGKLLDGKVTIPTNGSWSEIQIGGPFLGSSTNSVGNQIGDVQNEALLGIDSSMFLDPWGRNLVAESISKEIGSLGLSYQSLLWRPAYVNSLGPDGTSSTVNPHKTEILGDDLGVIIHLFPVLAKETQRRIDVVNQAILAFRKDHGKDQLGTDEGVFASHDGSQTVYTDLVAKGYLHEPTVNGVPVPLYAMDAWGFLLLADAQAHRLKESGKPAPVVLSVYSGNLLWPGIYLGKDQIDEMP